MERKAYKAKSGDTRYKPVLSSEEMDEVVSAGNMGWCLACGTEAYGVEPDARRYTCEDCGEAKVYGFEELLLMGLVEVGAEA